MITPADIEYKEFTKAVRGYKAVSYTHLDGYKRQVRMLSTPQRDLTKSWASTVS